MMLVTILEINEVEKNIKISLDGQISTYVKTIRVIYNKKELANYIFTISDIYFMLDIAIIACLARYIKQEKLGNVYIETNKEDDKRILLPFDYIFMDNTLPNYDLAVTSCHCSFCGEIRKRMVDSNETLSEIYNSLNKHIYPFKRHNKELFDYIVEFLMTISRQDMMRYYIPTKIKELKTPFESKQLCQALYLIKFYTPSKSFVKELALQQIRNGEEVDPDIEVMFEKEISRHKRNIRSRKRPQTDAW